MNYEDIFNRPIIGAPHTVENSCVPMSQRPGNTVLDAVLRLAKTRDEWDQLGHDVDLDCPAIIRNEHGTLVPYYVPGNTHKR